MATNQARPAPPPGPPPPASGKSPRSTIPEAIKFEVSSGVVVGGERIVIYGTGGIGKSTLAAYLPGPLFVDVEDGTRQLNVSRVSGVTAWSELRGGLAHIAKSPPRGVQTVVIDTATVAEEMAKDHVVATKKNDKGRSVSSLDEFGWGKGWHFVYDEFNGLLADLDRIVAQGIHVCLIAHEVSSPVPNPAGEDFIRWEPHLYSGDKRGAYSIRDRVKQWADHVVFVSYDVYVEDGKGRGTGTRTAYTSELPTHLAKSRVAQLAEPFDLQNPDTVWRKLRIVGRESKDQ